MLSEFENLRPLSDLGKKGILSLGGKTTEQSALQFSSVNDLSKSL